MNATQKITPIILAGGSGTRLWPVSREEMPKQFCKVDGKKSLFQMTVLRVSNSKKFNEPIIVSNENHMAVINTQLLEIDKNAHAIISEPFGRDTAPAIALAVEIYEADEDAIMLVLPSDHLIEDDVAFEATIAEAAQIAKGGKHIVTLGIKPTQPETGYGYLRTSSKIENRNAFELEAFIEKPSRRDATKLIEQDNVFWNAGIFVFNGEKVRNEIEALAPKLHTGIKRAIAYGKWEDKRFSPDASIFVNIQPISFDYAIMEKTEHVAMVPANSDWSDLGSWKAVWETSKQDENHNVVQGEVYYEDTCNSLMISNGPAIAVSGVEDVIVVANKDAVLVTSRENPQGVKALVAKMNDDNAALTKKHNGETRPWGSFDSLHVGDMHQVKHIRVVPGGQLSLQYHHHRAEHWVVVNGIATVTVDEEVMQLSPCQQVFIPQGAVHRLENFTDEPVDIIEVQYGSYLGEDDIVRMEDIYGRDPVETSNVNSKVA